MKLKRTQLFGLQDGTPFTMPSCPEFKYMYLVRGGDCTCRVQGYKLNENGVYIGFSEFFSPSTEVLHDASRLPMYKDNDGGLTIVPSDKSKEVLNVLDKEAKKVDNEGVKKTKTKKQKKTHKMNIETPENPTEIETAATPTRGRKKKYFVELPRDEEFTIPGVALKLGVEKYVVSNEVSKIKRTSPDSLELVRQITGGKGKPTAVYKLK